MIEDVIVSALRSGEEVDLSGCVYGKNGVLPSYYRFLAGLCRDQKVETVLEVGTFMGGSSLAMYKGASSNANAHVKVVTADLEARNVDQIKNIAAIDRVIGDPLALPVLKKISEKFSGKPIDVMFLDSTKVGRIVMSQFSTLSMMFRPKFVIMDDITLNPSMSLMWGNLVSIFGKNATNFAETFPAIRKQGEINPEVKVHPGFGFIDARNMWGNPQK